MPHYAHLAMAIMAEVAATLLLPSSRGFTRLMPCLGVLAGYGAAFYFLSLALHAIPVAIAYAMWSGIGTALVTILSWFITRQPFDVLQVVGIGLVIAGSSILHLGGHEQHSP